MIQHLRRERPIFRCGRVPLRRVERAGNSWIISPSGIHPLWRRSIRSGSLDRASSSNKICFKDISPAVGRVRRVGHTGAGTDWTK